jgi:hypothetical protein
MLPNSFAYCDRKIPEGVLTERVRFEFWSLEEPLLGVVFSCGPMTKLVDFVKLYGSTRFEVPPEVAVFDQAAEEWNVKNQERWKILNQEYAARQTKFILLREGLPVMESKLVKIPMGYCPSGSGTLNYYKIKPEISAPAFEALIIWPEPVTFENPISLQVQLIGAPVPC